MSPIPGIVASQIQGHLSTNNYTSIQSYAIGSGGASSVTFSSIPQTYTHLQIRLIGRTSATGATNNDIAFTVGNGSVDTGANYSRHRFYGTGSANNSSGAPSVNYAGSEIGVLPASDQLANVFGVGIIDILDYTNTNKDKTMKILCGIDDNSGTTTSRLSLSSSTWYSTSAINIINLFSSGGWNLLQYSHIALYGVK